MTSVLAAPDFSATGQPVLNAAIALAELYDATAICLHFAQQPVDAAAALARSAAVELRELNGSPVEAIAVAARPRDVVALVIGTRGLSEGNPPAGQFALEVITHVEKPVAVVPPQASTSRRFHRILVPLEGSDEGSHALDGTIGLAQQRGLEIVALHVHSPATVPAFSDHAPHAQQAWEREFLSRYISSSDDRVALMHRLGIPAEVVVAVARETSADLIALSWSQDLSPGRAHVVAETLAHSDVPVLLLPIP